jgi:hypothetical protein
MSRQSGAGEASGIKSVADQGRSDGWSMSHCLERLVLAASVPARAFEPKPQRDGRLLPQPRPALLAAMPSLSSADISAQSMPVPAAVLPICLGLCHLLPACHVVTTV